MSKQLVMISQDILVVSLANSGYGAPGIYIGDRLKCFSKCLHICQMRIIWILTRLMYDGLTTN